MIAVYCRSIIRGVGGDFAGENKNDDPQWVGNGVITDVTHKMPVNKHVWLFTKKVEKIDFFLICSTLYK